MSTEPGAGQDDISKRHYIEAIIHLAASTIVPQSFENPLGYYKNNVSNSRVLIEWAIKQGVRYFIFSSTAAVYGSKSSTPLPEAAELKPESPYGWSKLMAERILRDASDVSAVRYAIFRNFNTCGADPMLRTGQATQNATHLIKVAVETGLGKRPEMKVFGTDYPTPDGTCIRDYVHVSDLVIAHFASLNYLRNSGQSQIFNCGYGKGHSVLEVIETVKRLVGSDFAVKFDARRPGDAPVSIAAVDHIRSVLQWKPRYDNLDVIVSGAVAWERQLSLSPMP